MVAFLHRVDKHRKDGDAHRQEKKQANLMVAMPQCVAPRDRSHRVPGKLENSENPHMSLRIWTTLPMFSRPHSLPPWCLQPTWHKRERWTRSQLCSERVLPEFLLTGSGNQPDGQLTREPGDACNLHALQHVGHPRPHPRSGILTCCGCTWPQWRPAPRSGRRWQ